MGSYTVSRFNGVTTNVVCTLNYFNGIGNDNFVADDSGSVWVGTDISGLYQITPAAQYQYYSGQPVNHIQIDSQNRVFFVSGTTIMVHDTGGFSVFNSNAVLPGIIPPYTTGIKNGSYYTFGG
jgi:hypothetical protein